LTVIGTRPQFVKYAAVADGVAALFQNVLVDTGQHYDRHLSGDFLTHFGLREPDHRLEASRAGALPQIADMMVKLGAVVEAEKPDFILCFGDTNSTLAAALAGVKSGIEVVHVEAGERNYTLARERVPPHTIPEEANRVMTDHVAALNLCASARAEANLRAEQVRGRVAYTGDITYDLYRGHIERALQEDDVLAKHGLEARGFYFCTVHRALNTECPSRLGEIVSALLGAAKPVLLPLHPRTAKMLTEFRLMEPLRASGNVVLTEPVGYTESLLLNYWSDRVITDSGGVVREAFFNGIPSVLLDDTTEWIDLVEHGWSSLVGADREAIGAALLRPAPDARPALFGDGTAVPRTVSALQECYG
jgi:UDP-GlcNAc3NAcA epimerase